MAKKTNEQDLPVRVGDVPEALLNLALAGGGDDSLETMRHHRVLNRLALVQGMSKREVKDQFGEGSFVIPAANIKVSGRNETFDIIPVMFFDEFITWSDRNDKSGPKIRERSLDRSSVLAAKCGDPMRRQEAYGDVATKFKMKHTHHLNFLVVLDSGELKGTLAVLSFSRSEFRTGMAFISAIKLRRLNGSQAPLWATRWTVTTGNRKNEKGEWYGIDVSPASSPWIDGEMIAPMKAMHEELKREYKEQALVVGHEAADLGGEEGETDHAASTDM
jgi:hypothetical protein